MLRIAGPQILASNFHTQTFSNPLHAGADPWVVQRDGHYFSCNTGPGNRIEVWKSDTFIERQQRSVVWTPPRFGWNRAQIWAPELHFLRDKWYIYYAASTGRNATHRMGVLESLTTDPQGDYIDHGMLDTGGRWAIDGTVLESRGQTYFIWSGWADHRDVQHLYIAPMKSPTAVASPGVMVCPNDCHLWERVGERASQRGLHEGPQVLQRNGRLFLVYSTSGSWQTTYKLGMLELIGSDPLQAESWRKYSTPVFESTNEVFGVGHCCFVQSADGQDWIVYHAKTRRRDGWRDRVVRAQPFGWRADGTPDFGSPASPSARLRRPSAGTELQLQAA